MDFIQNSREFLITVSVITEFDSNKFKFFLQFLYKIFKECSVSAATVRRFPGSAELDHDDQIGGNRIDKLSKKTK